MKIKCNLFLFLTHVDYKLRINRTLPLLLWKINVKWWSYTDLESTVTKCLEPGSFHTWIAKNNKKGSVRCECPLPTTDKNQCLNLETDRELTPEVGTYILQFHKTAHW